MTNLMRSLVVEEPPKPFEGTWHVRNLVREAITFAIDEHDPAHVESTSLRHQRQLRVFRQYLAATYDSKLLVKRREFERLPLIIDQSKYVVLVGPRGGGKTSIVHDCVMRLRALHGEGTPLDPLSPASHSVHLIDLARLGQQIRFRANGQTPRNVCEILYRSLYGLVFGVGTERRRPGSKELLERWSHHRLTSSAPFAPLWQTIQDDPNFYDEDPVQVARSSYSVDWNGATHAFNSTEFDGKFEVLLEFVSELGHTPIFFIDNVDRYSRRLHEQLNERVQHIANRGLNVRMIVSFRASSYRSLRRLNQIDGSTTLVELVGQDNGCIPTLDDDLQELDSETAQPNGEVLHEAEGQHFRLHLTDSLYNAILTRRLKAVNAFLGGEGTPTYAAVVETLTADGRSEYDAVVEELGHHTSDEISSMGLASFLEFERTVVRLLQSNLRDYTHLDPRRTFLRWHNYSIRSALSHHFEELSNAISGFDPLFPSAVGTPWKELPQVSEHDYRTMLWRHLVASRGLDGTISVFCNVFEGTQSSRFPVFFPRLKLLQLLCKHSELPHSMVKEKMLGIGFSHATTSESLRVLRLSRGFESGGLIRIDCPDDMVEEEVPESAAVKVRPAGRYFLSYLIPSCEYLFWTAMNTDFGGQWRPDVRELTAGKPHLTRDDVLSDSTRVRVAAQFLRHWILPRYGIEMAMVDQPPERCVAQLGHFATDFSCSEAGRTWFYPSLIVGRLRSFVRHSGMASSVKAQSLQEIGALEALCEKRISQLTKQEWWSSALSDGFIAQAAG